jgi:hypothetical protein
VARPPDRKRTVFFLGAGFSCAAGLPNTAALLASVHALAKDIPAWGVSKNIERRLQDAYAYFYPDKGTGFRPEVVDFFSVLTAYSQIDRTGMPGGFPDRELLADLRFAIVHVLCEGLRQAEPSKLAAAHELLDRMVAPGNVVITTNWDSLVERAAEARGVAYRLSGQATDSELLVLKLHGSIDWLRPSDAKKAVGRVAYAQLTELCGSARGHRSTPTTASDVLRTRIDSAGATWRTIKGATADPFMVTMTPGKADALGPVLTLWEQAYRAISGAASLELIGYSMPADDIEIRTILRAGVLRGPTNPMITVRNPAPDVHARVRDLILREVDSDYLPVPPMH